MAHLPDRVLQLLDAGSVDAFDLSSDGDCVIGAYATLSGRPILVGCVDGRRSAGTLALPHFAQLIALMEVALVSETPLLLFLDSAGVRLQDTVSAELGFRHALFAACSFDSRGGQALSIVPGPLGTFGAAALIGLCIGPTAMAEGTRMAVAGPKALEAYGGKAQFDASDPIAVSQLMGARVRYDNGFVSAVLDPNREDVHQKLADLLGRMAEFPDANIGSWSPTGTFTLPDGQLLPLHDGVVFGPAVWSGQKVEVAGVVPGTELTVQRAQQICALLDVRKTLPLCLLSDAEQSLAPSEDFSGLASAYARLARQIAQCRLAGRSVSSFSWSGGSGAAFMILGMMAQHATLGVQANCRAVPEKVAKVLLGEAYANASGPAQKLFEIGAVEAIVGSSEEYWTTQSLLVAPQMQRPTNLEAHVEAAKRVLQRI